MFAFPTEPISLLGLQARQENQVLRRDVVRREHLWKFLHLLGSLLAQLLEWRIVPVQFHLSTQPHWIQLPRISTRNYQQARHARVFWLYPHIDLLLRRMHCPREFKALEQFFRLLQKPVSIRVYPIQSTSTLSMRILSAQVLFCLVLILWCAALSPKQNRSSFLFRQLTSTIA